jgi:hypothetical protein
MARACGYNGDTKNTYRILVDKPTGERPLRKWWIKLDIR